MSYGSRAAGGRREDDSCPAGNAPKRLFPVSKRSASVPRHGNAQQDPSKRLINLNSAALHTKLRIVGASAPMPSNNFCIVEQPPPPKKTIPKCCKNEIAENVAEDENESEIERRICMSAEKSLPFLYNFRSAARIMQKQKYNLIKMNETQTLGAQ